MKKSFLMVVFALLLLIGSSCSRTSAGIHAESSIPTALSTDSSRTTEAVISESPFLITDLNFLVSHSDYIIIGKVDEALPVVRIDAAALGLVEGIPKLEKNVSSFQIKIDQVIKGDIAPGDTIRVDRNAGLAEGIKSMKLMTICSIRVKDPHI